MPRKKRRVARYCHACRAVAKTIDAYYQSIQEHFTNCTLSAKNPWPYKMIKLGSVEDLSKSDCTSCQDIINKLIQDDKLPSLESNSTFWLNGRSLLIGSSETFWIKLCRLEASAIAYEVGRLFDAQRTDIILLRKWIDCCHTSHHGRCLSSELPLPSHQIYLIDVDDGCLVHSSAKCRYVALSYVWGEAAAFRTTKCNLASLKEPRSIRADADDLSIPNTIRDALRLVSMLGQRYLWVDSFCIVQDDQEVKQKHLNSMASIYANAYFTIVAADGSNANHGLRGIGGGAKPRNVACDIVRLPNGNDMIAQRPRAWDPETTPWQSRGWTFQEGHFSRRVLIFNGLVSWVCRTAIWEEHISSPTEDTIVAARHEPSCHNLDHLAGQHGTWPDVDKWTSIAGEFNQKKLTYESDVVDAFSGITSALSGQFSGGVLWGIPEMFFDYLIIWRPVTPLRRRKAHIGSSFENILPSWSWLGWEGAFVPLAYPILTQHPKIDCSSIEIQSLVVWYKSESVTSNLCLVKNVYPSLYQTYRDKELSKVPAGWTRGLYPGGTPYYIHDTMPLERFRFPLPLLNENIGSQCNEQGRHLFFKAQRAWLFAGQNLTLANQKWTNCSIHLVDIDGNWAGTLQLSGEISDRPLIGMRCELIALSLGTAENRDDKHPGYLDEWYLPERPRDGEFYRFYNVLWIEWEGFIAYRKAVGTVYKEMWDSQRLEDVDVILG